jgi:hypothetical protein
MSDIDVTINNLLLLVVTFIAGYLCALLRERIALRRERNAERSLQGQEEPAPAAGAEGSP